MKTTGFFAVLLSTLALVGCGSNASGIASPDAVADMTSNNSPPKYAWCPENSPGGGESDASIRLTDGGHEVQRDLNNDPMNCGSCGYFCWDELGVSQQLAPEVRSTIMGTVRYACVAGRCVFACAERRGDCDGQRPNGCEVSTATDVKHCGSCGKVCMPDNEVWRPTCTDGVCGKERR